MTSTPPASDHATMSLGDHLDELRKRVLLAFLPPLPLFIVIFALFSDPLLEWLVQPVLRALANQQMPATLQSLNPPEALLIKLKLSVIAAVVIGAPWIFYQAWLFIAPGLYAHERRFVHALIPGSAVLSAAGISLLYYVMLPLMLHMLILVGSQINVSLPPPDLPDAVQQTLDDWDGRSVPIVVGTPAGAAPGDIWFDARTYELRVAWSDDDDGAADSGASDDSGSADSAGPVDQSAGGAVAVDEDAARELEITTVPAPQVGRVNQSFRLRETINFTLMLVVGIVVAFQLPLVILLLGWLGLAERDWLASRRRHALLVLGVVSSIITPADAVSMVMMLIPLYALYELGIILLVIMPADRVAEGNVLRFSFSSLRRKRRDDATPAPTADPREQIIKPAQPDSTIARSTARKESDASGTDEEHGSR